jgi:hypothetical protein
MNWALLHSESVMGQCLREALLAEGVGFEPTRERNPLPVFKTGALNHSATLPCVKFQ